MQEPGSKLPTDQAPTQMLYLTYLSRCGHGSYPPLKLPPKKQAKKSENIPMCSGTGPQYRDTPTYVHLSFLAHCSARSTKMCAVLMRSMWKDEVYKILRQASKRLFCVFFPSCFSPRSLLELLTSVPVGSLEILLYSKHVGILFAIQLTFTHSGSRHTLLRMYECSRRIPLPPDVDAFSSAKNRTVKKWRHIGGVPCSDLSVTYMPGMGIMLPTPPSPLHPVVLASARHLYARISPTSASRGYRDN